MKAYKKPMIVKTTTNRREYKIKSDPLMADRYYDEGWNYYHNYSERWSCKNNRKFWKKMIVMYEVRMYRTWKYNRKTQWKNTE